jgi:hypothetical protein
MQGCDKLVDYKVKRHADRFKAQAKFQRTVILLAQLVRIQASFSFVLRGYLLQQGGRLKREQERRANGA